MERSLAGIGFGCLLASGLLLGACAGDDAGGEQPAGSGGSGGAATAGGSAGSATTAGTGGGDTAGSGTGGSASAGGASGSGGSVATGGTGADGEGGAPGAGGATTEPCTPASTEGIAYAGTCTYDTYCSDQYDTMLGAAALQQICEGQAGTWSTTPCDAAIWEMRCTQAAFGGVYVHYMPADGVCALGCEEPL